MELGQIDPEIRLEYIRIRNMLESFLGQVERTQNTETLDFSTQLKREIDFYLTSYENNQSLDQADTKIIEETLARLIFLKRWLRQQQVMRRYGLAVIVASLVILLSSLGFVVRLSALDGTSSTLIIFPMLASFLGVLGLFWGVNTLSNARRMSR